MKMLNRFDIEPSAGRPEVFAALIRRERERWQRVARSLGLGET